MGYFWPIVVVVLMIFAAMLLLQILYRPTAMPYRRRGRLVTKSELKFYSALRHAIGDRWEIFAMVRIADLLAVEKGTAKRQSWFNRISSKHVDFVLCDPDTLEVVVAIELDDRSHERPDRVERDRFVNAAFESADLPLLRFPTDKRYDVSDLRRQIKSVT